MKKEENKFDENLILSGIIKFGRDGFADCCDIIKAETFDGYLNQLIFSSIEKVFSEGNPITITSVFQKTGLGDDRYNDVKSILSNDCYDIKDIRPAAIKVRKRQFKNEAIGIYRKCIDDIYKIDENQPASKIITAGELALFDLIAKGNYNEDSGPTKIQNVVRQYVQEWEAAPAQNVGIPLPWRRFNESIGGGLRSGVHLVGARLKVGKAQPLDSRVLTPYGFKLMGHVEIGDELISPNGESVFVTDIFEHPNKQIYKMTFKGGYSVESCDDHIWQVEKNRHDYQNYEQLKTTKELMEDICFNQKTYKTKKKWKIKLIDPIEYKYEYKYVIPPYTMGALIGDGSITCSVNLTSNDPEIAKNIANELIGTELQIVKLKAKFMYSIKNIVHKPNNIFMDEIRKLDLDVTSHNKYIPNKYKYGSIETRKELLRGLFNTDGSADRAYIEYSTASEMLAQDICFVVQSLGGIATYKSRYTKCNGKSFLSYRLSIKFDDCSDYFKLTRKKEISKKRSKYNNRHLIEKIEPSRVCDARCISVTPTPGSINDGMYITNNFVKTHNTSIGLMTAIHAAVSYGVPVLILDTEMLIKDVLPRMVANISDVEISTIERGLFVKDEFKKKCIYQAVSALESVNICHRNVGGYEFDDIISTIRRWIYTDVGLQPNGEANPMLVIFDYFKVMNAKELATINESQALGFQISKMVDFSKKFNFPCLSFVQLNRDGISREDSAAVGNSDKLAQLANSLTIFKKKTIDEVNADGPENGNRKLITTDSRYGGESDYASEYISLQMKKESCILQELNFEPKRGVKLQGNAAGSPAKDREHTE